MKITVLCGGISTEREVSLKTASRVADALQKKGNEVVMIDVFFGASSVPDFSVQRDFFAMAEELKQRKGEITEELKKEYGLMGPNVFATCKASDVVFIGLHGENGEDGKIQAVFEEAGIAYTGSDSRSSAIAMSKAKTKELVSPYIEMPRGIVLHRDDAEETIAERNIKAPLVIKPSNGGSSVGVLLVMDDAEFEKALAEDFQYDDTVLVEEYIKGRELTQAVLDGVALPPVEICPNTDEWYDYENKYNGKTLEICPAEIPEEVLKEMSEKSVRFGEIVGLSVYYRIDYLLSEDGKLYALEANSLPGMTETSLVPQEAEAVGISYLELCEKIIQISLAKYGK